MAQSGGGRANPAGGWPGSTSTIFLCSWATNWWPGGCSCFPKRCQPLPAVFLSHDFHHELFEEYKELGRSFRQMKITSTTKFLKTGNLTTSAQAAKLAQGDHGEN